VLARIKVSRARLLAEGVTVNVAADASESSHVGGGSHDDASVVAYSGALADVADLCNRVGVFGRAATQREQLDAWYQLPPALTESASCVSAGAQTIASEADVAIVVTWLVRDLINVLELPLMVRAERTVLQWRPGTFLLTANGRIVGLIEVKKDGTSNRDPFLSAAVAGQLWDYVELLEQSGVSNAVAMLHTGKRAAIVARAPGDDRTLQMTDIATTAPDVAKLTLQYLRTANALSISAPTIDFSAAVSERLVRCVSVAGTIRWQQVSTSGLRFRAVPEHVANAEIVLWTELGRGAFGSCFLASIGDCAFALKVLATAPSSSISSPADQELDNLKAVYKQANGWSDEIVNLFAGSWAVTRDRLSMLAMPLCTALPVAERTNRLADVEAALKKLASSTIAYRLDDDFGWGMS
jgi:hypothetical protein